MASKNSDYLSRTKRQYFGVVLLALLSASLILTAAWVAATYYLHISSKLYIGLIVFGTAIILSWVLALVLSKRLIEPVKALWQLIIHITPNGGLPAPDIDSLKIGHELVADLSAKCCN